MIGRLAAMLGVVVLATSPARAADAKDPVPDSELLLNLDLLKETDLTRERDFLRRLRMLEWLRLLETWPLMDSQTPTAPAQKEKK